MIHVGSTGGVLALVPMSSSIMHSTPLTLEMDACTLPSLNLSSMKQPVFMYHALPSARASSGRCAMKAYLPSLPLRGFWSPIRAVSPSAVMLAM